MITLHNQPVLVRYFGAMSELNYLEEGDSTPRVLLSAISLPPSPRWPSRRGRRCRRSTATRTRPSRTPHAQHDARQHSRSRSIATLYALRSSRRFRMPSRAATASSPQRKQPGSCATPVRAAAAATPQPSARALTEPRQAAQQRAARRGRGQDSAQPQQRGTQRATQRSISTSGQRGGGEQQAAQPRQRRCQNRPTRRRQRHRSRRSRAPVPLDSIRREGWDLYETANVVFSINERAVFSHINAGPTARTRPTRGSSAWAWRSRCWWTSRSCWARARSPRLDR